LSECGRDDRVGLVHSLGGDVDLQEELCGRYGGAFFFLE
jgi:hypothetical protein